MKTAYVNNIVDMSVDGYDLHGVWLCLRYLRYLTYLSNSQNNWYRHTPPTPRATLKRFGKNIVANVGYVDKTASSKAFRRLSFLGLSTIIVDGGQK